MTLGKWIGVIVFTVSLYILWRINQVILLAFVAITVATAINRLVRQFQKFGVKRIIAVIISVGALLVLLSGCIALIIPSLTRQWSELVDEVTIAVNRLEGWYNIFQNSLPNQFIDGMSSPNNLIQQFSRSASQWFSQFYTLFSASLGTLLNTILIIALTIMLVSNPQPYRKGFLSLFPSFYRQRADEILSKCEHNLVGSVLGLLFNMAVITFLSGMGLWILGVKLPVVNALIAGFLTFIPNIGPAISVIPPALLAFLDAPWKVVAVIILYVVIQQIESNILTPLVMQNNVSLLPAITLISQVIFASFFGFLGLLLAIPLVAVLQVWFQELLVKDILNQMEEKHS
ncbi:MAG: AI-2E family transporter [Microcoleaceae cyanobacterium]